MATTVTIEIDAPPERVFPWLADSGRVMQWAEGVVENEDLETTPDKVGSTFRQVYDEDGRRMEFRGTVTSFEQDRRLGVHLTSRMFDLQVDYTLEALGGDRTRLVQRSEVSWNGLMKLVGPLMTKMMQKKGEECVEADFGRLKAFAEGEAAPA